VSEIRATRLPVDPLTASFWRAEAKARGLTLQEFLTTAVERLLTPTARLEKPSPAPVPSRTNW
jgi:hypothetical protein